MNAEEVTGAWEAALLDFRARKDAHFRSGRGPVPAAKLSAFTGLAYFPPDPAWNLHLEVERVPSEPVTLATTTPGETQTFVSWGAVNLSAGGRLILYARADGGAADGAPRTLFLPFRDVTSGVQTYGAGRYLDAPTDGEMVTLDFNRAYHPYCAFSDAWACPLPPAGNRLNIAVEAGERLPVQRVNTA